MRRLVNGHAVHGQQDAEGAAAPLLARDVDAPAVAVDDLRADEESQPGAALGILRRDERIEHALELRTRDPTARVGDLDLHLAAARARRHAGGASRRRALEGAG